MGRARNTFVHTVLVAALAVTAGCGRDAPVALEEDPSAVAGVSCSAPKLAVTRLEGTTLVLFDAQATCSAGAPQYEFFVRAPGTKSTIVKGYNSDWYTYWDPAKQPVSGRYTVTVWVRPQGSTKSYDAWASTSLLVGDVCSSVTLKSRASGSSVELEAAATCSGAAKPEYRFFGRAPGTTVFTPLGDYGASASASYSVGSASGRWEFIVYARAVGNLSDYESSVRASALRGGDVFPGGAPSGSGGAGVRLPHGLGDLRPGSDARVPVLVSEDGRRLVPGPRPVDLRRPRGALLVPSAQRPVRVPGLRPRRRERLGLRGDGCGGRPGREHLFRGDTRRLERRDEPGRF